ncbi:MAG: hypothetical protein ACI4UU_00320 [Clostridia bacterium]
MKKLQQYGVCTLMWAIILIFISVLCQIGNWPDNFLAKTMFWFLPSIISFFFGMMIETECFEMADAVPEKGYHCIAAIFFGIIILSFSVISNIKHWPHDWLYETLTWWPISIFSFYLGMRTEAIWDKLEEKKTEDYDYDDDDEEKEEKEKKEKKEEKVHLASSNASDSSENNDCSVSIVTTQKNIKDKIQNAEVQDVEFLDIVEEDTSHKGKQVPKIHTFDWSDFDDFDWSDFDDDN